MTQLLAHVTLGSKLLLYSFEMFFIVFDNQLQIAVLCWFYIYLLTNIRQQSIAYLSNYYQLTYVGPRILFWKYIIKDRKMQTRLCMLTPELGAQTSGRVHIVFTTRWKKNLIWGLKWSCDEVVNKQIRTQVPRWQRSQCSHSTLRLQSAKTIKGQTSVHLVIISHTTVWTTKTWTSLSVHWMGQTFQNSHDFLLALRVSSPRSKIIINCK